MKAFGLEVRAVPKVNPKSAEEVWVTADGRRIAIGEMTEGHAKHALSMIMRRLRAGQFATLDRLQDRIKFYKRVTPKVAADPLDVFDPLGQDGGISYGKPGDPGVYFPLLPIGGRP
jgi:hypothetical protein